jgi:Divergent InlB B-repeat domain
MRRQTRSWVGLTLLAVVFGAFQASPISAHDKTDPRFGVSEAARQASQSPNLIGSTQSRAGQFHVIFGDAPSSTGVPGVAGYVLIDDQGQAIDLIIDEQLLRLLGGAHTINQQRVVLTGRDALAPAGFQLALPLFAVDAIQPDGPRRTASELAAAQAVSGPQPWATVLCRFADFASTTPNPVSYFQSLVMGGTAPSLDHFWREHSYNNVNLAGSAVYGWYNLPQPRSYYVYGNPLQLDFSRAGNDCAGAAAGAGVSFTSFVGINLIFNADLDGFAWGGSYTLFGRVYRTTWVPPWGYQNQGPIAHEMGHGFGLAHSSGPYSATYDSRWDVMSDIWDSCPPVDPTYGCVGVSTIAYHKDKLGWIPGAQKYVASPGTTKTLLMERLDQPTTSNYLIAQLPIVGSSTQFYTVEVRRFAGYDAKVPGEAVVLHKVDTTLSDRNAKVVDTDGNGNSNDAGAMWTPGETFQDATNGLTVTVNAQVGNGYQLTICNGPCTAQQFSVTVVRAGTGSGTVTSGDGAINCGSTCSANFASGAQVTLTASAAAGSTFGGWTGCTSANGATCSVTVSAATTVTATFTANQVTLTVTKGGSGVGTVTTSDGKIVCGATCSANFSSGAQVTLTASAAAGSTFSGWTGCPSANGATCSITVTAATTVTATFTLNQVTLTVTKGGSATGMVTSTDGKIGCGGTCSAVYPAGTNVTLTAGTGAIFKQWGGACSASGGITTCGLALTGDTAVTATFSAPFTDGSGPNSAITGAVAGGAPGATVIKAQHVLELRMAIDALRAVNGIGGYNWTDAALSMMSTVAKRIHFSDLRSALAPVCAALAGRCVAYTDPALTTGQTIIKAAHLNELRANVRALE